MKGVERAIDPADRAFKDPAFSSRYELGEVLGTGGMGVVRRGVQLPLGRAVAIKFLSPKLLEEDESSARFVAEARLASSILHGNVVSVIECGIAGSVPYLVTELVQGGTLASLLERRGPLPLSDALALARQMLDGLDAIHAAGIVHRDFKPANVLIAPGPPLMVKIADFGIAKAFEPRAGSEGLPKTATGMVLGTPEYMSPEQSVGDPATPVSDLYALSLVLYRMVVGAHPFQASSLLEMVHKQVHAQPEYPADLHPRLRDLLAHGLTKLPAQRIDAAGFRAELDRLIRDPGAQDVGPGAAASSPPASAATASNAATMAVQSSGVKPRQPNAPPTRPASKPMVRPALSGKVPAFAAPARKPWVIPVAVALALLLVSAAAYRLRPRSPAKPASLQELDELLAFTFSFTGEFETRKFFAVVRKHPALRELKIKEVALSQTARLVDRVLFNLLGSSLRPRGDTAQSAGEASRQLETEQAGPGEAGLFAQQLRAAQARTPPSLDDADTIISSFIKAGTIHPSSDAASLHPANAIWWFQEVIRMRNAEDFKEFIRAFRRLEIAAEQHPDAEVAEQTFGLLYEILLHAEVVSKDPQIEKLRKWQDRKSRHSPDPFDSVHGRLKDFVADTADVVVERWVGGDKARIDVQRFRRQLLMSAIICDLKSRETGQSWRDSWDIPVRVSLSTLRKIKPDTAAEFEPVLKGDDHLNVETPLDADQLTRLANTLDVNTPKLRDKVRADAQR